MCPLKTRRNSLKRRKRDADFWGEVHHSSSPLIIETCANMKDACACACASVQLCVLCVCLRVCVYRHERSTTNSIRVVTDPQKKEEEEYNLIETARCWCQGHPPDERSPQSTTPCSLHAFLALSSSVCWSERSRLVNSSTHLKEGTGV